MSEGLSAERLAQLEQRKAETRNCWRISTDCGNPPTDAHKVWDMVWLELQFHCSDFRTATSIAYHSRQWMESRNPFHIDAAVMLCSDIDISPPPTLAELVADVARRRMAGQISGGTPESIFKEAAKDHALSLMTNLCAAGLTRAEAASKAAAQLLNPIFGAHYKASSLQKEYRKDKSRRATEAKRREYWKSAEGAQQKAEWLSIIPSMPDAPPELQGEVR